MIKYARLTLPLREVIENMHADGYVQEAIAAAVGVDQSTVSRELRRRPGAYAARPCHAQAQSRSRIPTTVPLLDRNGELRRHLVNRMCNKYSIAQSLRLIGPSARTCRRSARRPFTTGSTPATPTTGSSSEAS